MSTPELNEAVSRRIRALLSKTTENGATEAEAIAAAVKARELMDAYRLTMTDIEIQSEPVIQEEVDRPNAIKYAAVDYCGKGIEAYCGVRSWMRSKWDERRGRYTVRVFIGLKPDVEMAHYLYVMIDGAIKSELAAFQRSRGYRDRGDTASFQLGMARRINARLHDMARELEPVAVTATGTALVLVKNAVVNQAYDALGLKFRGSYAGMSNRSHSAYTSGQTAGNRVNLSRPVTTTSQPKLNRY